MKKNYFLGVSAAVLIALSGAAYADDAMTATTSTTVKSVAVPGATTQIPAAGTVSADVIVDDSADAIPADEDSASVDAASGESFSSSGEVTTTTTTTDTVTTTIVTDPKPPIDPTATGVEKPNRKKLDNHGEKGSDEATTAGDKAAKSVTPLEHSTIPGSEGTVEQKGDAVIVH